MVEWIKQFGLKVWNEIENNLAKYIAGIIIVIFLAVCLLLWEWSLTKHSLKLYGFIWLFLSILSIVLIFHFLLSVFRFRGRLKDPNDIETALEDWFLHGQYGTSVENNVPYYFYVVEKSLNLKRGSSKIYLPIVAWRNKHGFEMGKKTFKLTQLTDKNDVTSIFEQYLKSKFSSDAREFLISCNNIDRKLGWPEGVTKIFLSRNRPESNEFEIEDKGNDKILIICKT